MTWMFFFSFTPVQPFLKPSNMSNCLTFCAINFSDSLCGSGKHHSLNFKSDTLKLINCNPTFVLWKCRDINAFPPPTLLIPHINTYKCLLCKYHLHYLVWSLQLEWQKFGKNCTGMCFRIRQLQLYVTPQALNSSMCTEKAQECHLAFFHQTCSWKLVKENPI